MRRNYGQKHVDLLNTVNTKYFEVFFLNRRAVNCNCAGPLHGWNGNHEYVFELGYTILDTKSGMPTKTTERNQGCKGAPGRNFNARSCQVGFIVYTAFIEL